MKVPYHLTLALLFVQLLMNVDRASAFPDHGPLRQHKQTGIYTKFRELYLIHIYYLLFP